LLAILLLAVALKVVVAEPAGTVIVDAGTGKSVLLLDNETVVPPVGLDPLSVTVQVVLAEVLRVFGLQDTEVRVGAATPPEPVTTPPEAEVGMVFPTASVASVLLIPTDVLLTPAAIVRFTTATTPLAMVVVFIPVARQV